MVSVIASLIKRHRNRDISVAIGPRADDRLSSLKSPKLITMVMNAIHEQLTSFSR